MIFGVGSACPGSLGGLSPVLAVVGEGVAMGTAGPEALPEEPDDDAEGPGINASGGSAASATSQAAGPDPRARSGAPR